MPFLPAGIVICGWALWANSDGAYFPEAWYPSAIAAVGLLLATAVGTGRIVPSPRPAQIALGILAALVAFTFLSIAWSSSQATGWDSANKLLLYLAVAWTLSLLPWTPTAARIALTAWVVATVIVCAISLIGASGAGSLSDYFIEGRYLDPIGYSNGVSALPLLAFFPALWLSARRSVPVLGRAGFLAAAVFLAEFSLLPQSRGAVIGFGFATLVFIAIVPDRLRLIPPLLVVGGAVALSVGTIFHVYTIGIEQSEAIEAEASLAGLDLRSALDAATNAIVLSTVAAFALGLLIGVLDRGVSVGEQGMRRMRQGVAAAIGAVVLVGLLVALLNAGRISSDVSERWDTFKSSKDTPATTGTRFTANYSDQRYDYWRVAYEQFKKTPAAGAGAGSYEDIYSANRRFDKPSKYTHDIWLRFLAEGGLIGAGLFIAYLLAAALGLAGAWRRIGSEGRGVVAVCAAVLAYFVVHASFDWLDEFPALASPALALPLVGIVAGSDRAPDAYRGATRTWRSYLAIGAGIAVAAACVASLVFPYLAERHLNRGAEIGLANVQVAREELDRAASLNPLWAEPHLRAGTILIAAGDPRAARREYQEALEVEDNWYAHFQLALLDSEAGRHKAALAQLSQARALDRHDPLLVRTLSTILNGRRIDAAAFNSEIRRIEAERFTRPRS